MALGETAIHISPSLSYVRLQSLFPPRLSSFLVISSPSIFFCFTRFFSLYLFAILMFVGYGSIAGIISCSDYLLLALLFVFWFLFAGCGFPSVFYLEDILFVWFCSCLD